jgi:hypothetical protein
MDFDPTPNAIEVRVEEIAQLFHTLDPFPFRERDLDKEAEDFIVGWARELPANEPITIVVHLPRAEAETQSATELNAAFNRYFNYRAGALERDLKELFRVGRRSLAVGITTLAICVVIGRVAVSIWPGSPLTRLLEESSLILGWVANWRPLEIFLYDWWPLARRRCPPTTRSKRRGTPSIKHRGFRRCSSRSNERRSRSFRASPNCQG